MLSICWQLEQDLFFSNLSGEILPFSWQLTWKYLFYRFYIFLPFCTILFFERSSTIYDVSTLTRKPSRIWRMNSTCTKYLFSFFKDCAASMCLHSKFRFLMILIFSFWNLCLFLHCLNGTTFTFLYERFEFLVTFQKQFYKNSKFSTMWKLFFFFF